MRFLPIFTLSLLLLLLIVTSSVPLQSVRAGSVPVTITKHVDLGFSSNIPINFQDPTSPKCDFAIIFCVFSHYISFTGNAILKIDLGVDVSISYDPSLVTPGGTLPVTVTYTPRSGGSSAEFDISGQLTLAFSGCISCPTNAPFTLTSGSATFTAPMGTDSPVSIPGSGSSLDLSDIISATLQTNLNLGPLGSQGYPGLGGAAAFIQASGATITSPSPPVTEWDSSGISQTVNLQLPATLSNVELSLSPLVHWLQTSGSVSMALHWGKVADDIYAGIITSGCGAVPFPGDIYCWAHSSYTPTDISPINFFSGSLGQFYSDAGLNTAIGNAVTSATGNSLAGFAISNNIKQGYLPIPLLSPPLANIDPSQPLPNLGSANFIIYAGVGAIEFLSNTNVLVSVGGLSGPQVGCTSFGPIDATGCGTSQVNVKIPNPNPGVYSLQFFPPTGGPVELDVQSLDSGGNTLDTLSLTPGPGSSPQITLSAAGDLSFPYLAPTSLSTSPVSVSATEGIPFFSQTVATFTDPDGNTDPTQYSATINWGDGLAYLGTITYDTGTGTFAVAGNHTYSDEGTFGVNVKITDTDGSIGVASSTATVVSGALSASPISFVANAGAPTGGAIATFTDGSNALAQASDYTASIDWGDASPATVGTIAQDSSGVLTVYGSHTYSNTGDYTVAVTIAEDDGSSVPVTQSITVKGALCSQVSSPGAIDGLVPTAQDSCSWSFGETSSPQAYPSSTHLMASITGESGTPGSVTFLLSDLGGAPSQGLDPNLKGAAYYDLNIGGITDGTAQVCVSSPSSTLMDYFNGASFVPASNVVQYSKVFIGFGYICGNVPVSALGGTPISVGTPASPTTGVPEFPFGMTLVLVLAVFGALILRRISIAGRPLSELAP